MVSVDCHWLFLGLKWEHCFCSTGTHTVPPAEGNTTTHVPACAAAGATADASGQAGTRTAARAGGRAAVGVESAGLPLGTAESAYAPSDWAARPPGRDYRRCRGPSAGAERDVSATEGQRAPHATVGGGCSGAGATRGQVLCGSVVARGLRHLQWLTQW